jgi:hypothetical protein
MASFQDLIRTVGDRYDELRAQNAELLRERVHWQELGHQDQVLWQDWQLSRDDTADSAYDHLAKHVDSIPAIHVSKTAPASSWQQSDFPSVNRPMLEAPNRSPVLKRPANGPKVHKFTASGRQENPRVAPPVSQLAAPPHELVDIGVEENLADDGYATEMKAESSTKPVDITATSSGNKKDLRVAVAVPQDCTSWKSSNSQTDSQKSERQTADDKRQARSQQEKRIRRQFKRWTRHGRKDGYGYLWPCNLHKICEDMAARSLTAEPAPTPDQVHDALYQHIARTYPGGRVSKSSRVSKKSVRASSESADVDVTLDLEMYLHLIMEESEYESLEEKQADVISYVRKACLAESALSNDNESDGSFNGVNHEDSFSNNRLDTMSATVILINAVVIGVSSDIAIDSPGWQVLEVAFTAFFTGEVMYKLKKMGLRNFFTGSDWHWNIFDFAVVSIALVDLGITAVVTISTPDGGGSGLGGFAIIKMARLGRLARLVRLLRFRLFYQLKMMIFGIFVGLRVLFWAVVLLFFFIYLLGVILRKTMGDSDDHYAKHDSFETVSKSMFTLFRCFTDGCTAYDGTPLQVHLFNYYGAGFMFPYMLVNLFVMMGIFNLIMAIFIDNVMEESVHRKQKERGDSAAQMELNLKELVAKLIYKQRLKQSHFLEQAINKFEVRVSNYLDLSDPEVAVKHRTTLVDKDLAQMNEEKVTINREVFTSWLHEPAFLDMLEELDIGTSNKAELFDVLDCDLSGELEVAEVISGLMKLRGPSDKSDAVASLLAIRYITQRLDELHEIIEPALVRPLSTISSNRQSEARTTSLRPTTMSAMKSHSADWDDRPTKKISFEAS